MIVFDKRKKKESLFLKQTASPTYFWHWKGSLLLFSSFLITLMIYCIIIGHNLYIYHCLSVCMLAFIVIVWQFVHLLMIGINWLLTVIRFKQLFFPFFSKYQYSLLLARFNILIASFMLSFDWLLLERKGDYCYLQVFLFYGIYFWHLTIQNAF